MTTTSRTFVSLGLAVFASIVLSVTPTEGQGTGTNAVTVRTGTPLPLVPSPEAARLLPLLSLSTNLAASPGGTQSVSEVSGNAVVRGRRTNALKLINGVLTNTATPQEVRVAGRAAAGKREIRPGAEGAVADFGRHRVLFPSQINGQKPVRVITPEGKLLKFQPRFLAYRDTATGKSVLIGEIKDTTGEIHLPDEVWFRDCLTDVRATLRYHYTQTSLQQDILIESQLPAPEDWSLDPASTRIEFWTEMFDTVPARKPQTIQLRAGNSAAGLPAALATDETWDFGLMKITAGQAFSIGVGENDRVKVPVAKAYVCIPDGELTRSFLVESVDYLALKPKLERLPKTALNRSKRKVLMERASLIQSLSPRPFASRQASPLPIAGAGSDVLLAVNIDFRFAGGRRKLVAGGDECRGCNGSEQWHPGERS
jgi:hypothetical protein